jgi:toxin ParE1/3/4
MILRISSEASEDLASVWEYTKNHWGIAQADLYVDGFMMRFVWLGENRTLWRSRPDIRPGVYSCPYKSHVIFFSQSDGCINILRILHRRMDSGRHVE